MPANPAYRDPLYSRLLDITIGLCGVAWGVLLTADRGATNDVAEHADWRILLGVITVSVVALRSTYVVTSVLTRHRAEITLDHAAMRTVVSELTAKIEQLDRATAARYAALQAVQSEAERVAESYLDGLASSERRSSVVSIRRRP